MSTSTEQFANANRINAALSHYQDAMRDFVAPILEDAHGPDWFLKLVANEEAERERPRDYENAMDDLDAGVPPRDILEAKNFPFLIRANARLFASQADNLDDREFRALIDRMFMIVTLRNEAFAHRRNRGDISPDDADESVVQCRRVLSAFGLEDAAHEIRRLDAAPAAPVPAAPAEDLEFKRFRRDRIKEGILAKPESERSDLEAAELRDILLEEEWELRQLKQAELAEYEAIGGVITHRIAWFDVLQDRRERHPELWQLLEEDLAWEAHESERLTGTLTQRLGWFDKDEGRKQRYPSTLRVLDSEAESESDEVESLGASLQKQERWFAEDDGRRERNPVAWRETKRRRAETDRLEQERREQERLERERREQERLEQERLERERLEHERLKRKQMQALGRLCEVGATFSARLGAGGHSLGLRSDGTVAGWGWNNFGECDAPAGPFVAVSAGYHHSLGLRSDGTVVGWGWNKFGECDAPAGPFVAVSAGRWKSLGLRSDGTVVGWGRNEFGECDAPAGPFVAVSAGFHHSLGVRPDGAVISWGRNQFGECDAPAGPLVAVSAGFHHSLGLRPDGAVIGWGRNRFRVCDAPAGPFVSVSAGMYHSLALRPNGTVIGWGSNGSGNLDASPGSFLTAEQVEVAEEFLQQGRIFSGRRLEDYSEL